jgi:hypothetical protein
MSGYTANVIAHHGILIDEGVNFIQKPFSLHDLANQNFDRVEGHINDFIPALSFAAVSLAAMDIHGEVFAASNPFSPTNLADRHHFQEAIAKKTLATSNFMMSRVGMSVPTIAFAHPVLDIEGHLTGVVSAILNLENYVNLFDLAAFPPNSFAAVRGDIPIILCTGFSEQISASKARQKGIKGFLMKPLVRGELANMVRQVLDEAANDKS